MKIKFLPLLFIIPCSVFIIQHSSAQSPNWLWAKSIGGIDYDDGISIALDASGNVYTTGSFTDTVDFDPDTSAGSVFNLNGGAGGGAFISKLDALGNFIWAKAIGGNGHSIAIDTAGSGDVYTTGGFGGTVDFDPGPGVFNLTGGGGYISKLDASGNFIWAKAIGGNGGVSIVIDPSGSGAVYTIGQFLGTVDFDPGVGTFNLTSAGAQDIFVSKLDSSGNFVWAKAMGGTGIDYGGSIFIYPSGSGSVYTTGTFLNTVDFDPGAGTFNLTSAGAYDIFISKLDFSGNFVWAKAMGGADDDHGNAIAIDLAGSGAVYTTGSFEGTADFDPGTGVYNLTPVGSQDIFVSKLDSSGIFSWAKTMGTTGDEWGLSIAIDPTGSGAVYTTGGFSGTVDFDPGPGVYYLTETGMSGYLDVFISKLDGSGNFVCAKAVGGINRDDGNSIAIDASGNVYLTGYFVSLSITFGSTTLTNAGDRDIFIAKLDTMTFLTGTNDVSPDGSGSLNMTSIFPNPAITHISIALPCKAIKVEVTITDITGKIIYSILTAENQKVEVNTNDFAEGIYVVRIQSPDFTATKKLIVVK